MSNDDLANEMGALLSEVHSRINDLLPSTSKTRAQRLAAVAHGALEALRDHLADDGQIAPFSGGDPKPPTP
jgi:hypothetical protein